MQILITLEHVIEKIFRGNINKSILYGYFDSIANELLSKFESKNFTFERPLRIVFAYKGVSWKTFQDEMEKNDWENLFDIICILNRGIFINQREDKKLERLFGEYTKVDFLIAEGKSVSLGLLYYHLIS